jgi:hypothetical protein
MSTVCYLVRSSLQEGGLVFPSEMQETDPATMGAFYLLGRERGVPLDAYSFLAIKGEEVIRIQLEKDRKAPAFFRATVPQVGNFLFFAQPLARQLRYVGGVPELAGQFAIRRLRSWRLGDLEQACRKHEFYFVGYSPRIPAELGGPNG